VKIMPAEFVKPYVESNKNDALNAEAVAEAVTRPSMRFVQVKQPEQLDLEALDRARELAVSPHHTRIDREAFTADQSFAMQRVGTASNRWRKVSPRVEIWRAPSNQRLSDAVGEDSPHNATRHGSRPSETHLSDDIRRLPILH
jgi:hypothetical protein